MYTKREVLSVVIGECPLAWHISFLFVSSYGWLLARFYLLGHGSHHYLDCCVFILMQCVGVCERVKSAMANEARPSENATALDSILNTGS